MAEEDMLIESVTENEPVPFMAKCVMKFARSFNYGPDGTWDLMHVVLARST